MDALPTSFSSPLVGPLLVPGLTAVAGILLVVAFWRRTYSLHAPWERVWRLIAGGADVEDPRLRAFMQEMRDLEKFRLVYGLNVTNAADLHKLIRIIRKHRLDISILQKAKRWVDPSKPNIVSTPDSYFYLANGIGYFSALFLTTIMTLIFMSPAIFKGNSSGAWFATDGETIRSVYRISAHNLEKCKFNSSFLKTKISLTDSELQSVCNEYTDGTLEKRVARAISEQRILGATGFFIFALILFAVGLRLRGGRAAELLAKEIYHSPSMEKKPHETV